MRDSRLGRWAVVGPALVLVALACGDDSGGDAGASCSTFAACGGIPTGSWRSSAACVPSDVASAFAGLPPECADAIVLDDISASTTLTVGADGAITEQGSGSLHWVMTFGPDCMSAAAGGVAIDEVATRQFCDLLQNDLQEDPADGNLVVASCNAAGTTCSCTVQREQTIDNSFVVSVEGASFVYPGAIRQDFCVNGDQLELGPIQGVGLDGAYTIYERVSP